MKHELGVGLGEVQKSAHRVHVVAFLEVFMVVITVLMVTPVLDVCCTSDLWA